MAASTKRLPAAVLGFAAVLGLAANLVRADAPFYGASFEKPPAPAAMAAVGRALFFDPSLSASGKLACATCHNPAHAFGPADELPVQRGGADNARPGVRAVPSLTYTQNVPPFTEHFFDSEGDDSVDQGPAGGRTWDGRAQSAHEQARLPLLSPFEMANPSPQAVVAKVQRASYEALFRETFGQRVFDDAELAFKGVLLALETYQQTPLEFYPYTSKYDAYLRREASFTNQELRGLSAFNDPARGNCARCHPSAMSGGAFPQFTDFGYAAIGAPRNSAIPANGDPRYFDLGLCGPLRTDLKDRFEYCGRFRTPSLRNVAVRRVFFHNGVFHRLEDVVRFYVQRDTDPQKWYPRAPDGSVLKFDDLPARYRRNVDEDPPLDRRPGGRPAMTEAQVEDIVAFLHTLTDGFVRIAPTASLP
ncbi:MAG: cytochrome c peroxidase [Steroidobacteraceae bacterium]